MSAFLRQAQEIFDTARAAGAEDGELAVLVDDAGGVQVVQAGGWDAEALRVERGARSVYRISRFRGRVRLEGRMPGQGCLLEAARPTVAPPEFPWRSPEICHAIRPRVECTRGPDRSSTSRATGR